MTTSASGEHTPVPGFDDRSLPDRYCDLILTGGVTSAIAYPGIIIGLGQVYRFQSIGGSSSGAGTAALAAAAEYRRRHGSSDGFRTLIDGVQQVRHRIGPDTVLRWLFQPSLANRRLFNAVLRWFAGPRHGFWMLLWDFLRAYLLPLLLGLGLGIGVVAAMAAVVATCPLTDVWAWRLLAGLVGMLGGLLALGWALWRDIQRLVNSDYGMGTGQHALPFAPHPPLTAWLHGLIQDIAGLPLTRPLTFADLRQAPQSPCETMGQAAPAGAPSIDLQMFASDITRSRPLQLPLCEDEPPLFFRPFELRRLFAAEVVNHMLAHSTRAGLASEAIEPVRSKRFVVREEREAARAAADRDDERALWILPRLELPVIVAARMSVSFPVLFSAVPLWERCPKGQGFRRLLIMDGGLCSNFPIHLFDSAIPQWPTFGVALHDDPDAKSGLCPSAEDGVQVPCSHDEPPPDRWNRFDQELSVRRRLFGFAGAVYGTTKDWNDALLAQLPGVRERVAHISLPPGIGGLNILMSPQQIDFLEQRGRDAARQLLRRFAVPPGPGCEGRGWAEHRWVRFNVLAQVVQDTVRGLSGGAAGNRYTDSVDRLISLATQQAPLAQGHHPGAAPAQTLNAAEAASLRRTLDALVALERSLTPALMPQPYAPKPRPVWRMRPPL